MTIFPLGFRARHVIASDQRERGNPAHPSTVLPDRIASSRDALLAMTVRAVFSAFLAFAPPVRAQEPVQAAANARDFVTETFPYPLGEVYGRARLLFDSDKRDYYDDYNAKIYALPEDAKNIKDLPAQTRRKFLAFPLVRPNKFYVFYGAYPNMQGALAAMTPLAAMGHSNAALQRYAGLPESSRAYDLYVWSPDAPFWYSEYEVNGHPVPFKSYFIVHLSPVDDAHTEVEIIENEPVVYRGHKMSVDIHGLVHHDDIREVEPTTRDREFLLSCLRQFIDRNVPGRHWFNCRDKDETVETPTPFTVP